MGEEWRSFLEAGSRPVRPSLLGCRGEQEADNRVEERAEEEGSLSQGGQGEEEEATEEGEEGREAKSARSPVKVSSEEREKHELTHTPFRAWCKFCVQGRGTNEAHRKKQERQK